MEKPRPPTKPPFSLRLRKPKGKIKETLFIGIAGNIGNEFRLQTKALSLREATTRASRFVLTTPAASVRVIKESGEPLSLEERFRVGGFLGQKFRQAKTKLGSFVEKSTFRIDQPGELFGITKRGQQAKRNKNRGSIF